MENNLPHRMNGKLARIAAVGGRRRPDERPLVTIADKNGSNGGTTVSSTDHKRTIDGAKRAESASLSNQSSSWATLAKWDVKYTWV